MEKETTATGFLAISELYFKMTEQTGRVELLIANIDKSNLSMLRTSWMT